MRAPRTLLTLLTATAVVLPVAVAHADDPAAVPPKTTAAASASAKKGISAWQFPGVTKDLANSRAGWFYTWSSGKGGIKAPAGMQFVPMIWGPKSVTASNLNQAKAQGTTLLGFNEPDFASQSNMTVGRALDLWPRLQKTGMRLGAPAVATGAAQAGGWLDRFMKGARARGYRVDFIPLHWYGADFDSTRATSQLKSYVEATYKRYHKPIWVTEYALIDFSGGTPRYPSQAQQAAFVKKSTAMLQSLNEVKRYAWFTLSTSRGDGTGLYTGTTANQVGVAYRQAA